MADSRTGGGSGIALRRNPRRGKIPAAVATTAQGLARHLSLLFVPAGVGVMSYVGRVADEWLIAAALLVSTVLAIADRADLRLAPAPAA